MMVEDTFIVKKYKLEYAVFLVFQFIRHLRQNAEIYFIHVHAE